jgi:hypothetical protein
MIIRECDLEMTSIMHFVTSLSNIVRIRVKTVFTAVI